VAIDPKHLPEDPKILQQMVLDLMTQLDKEFSERNKIESLLRELLDAKRNRKSEQLSADQLALFAAAWQARQAEAEASQGTDGRDDEDDGAKPGAGQEVPKKKTGGRHPLPRHLKRDGCGCASSNRVPLWISYATTYWRSRQKYCRRARRGGRCA